MGPNLGDGREYLLQEILAVAGDHQGGRLREAQPRPIDGQTAPPPEEIIPVKDDGVQAAAPPSSPLVQINQLHKPAAEVQTAGGKARFMGEGPGSQAPWPPGPLPRKFITAARHRQRPPGASGCGNPGKRGGPPRWLGWAG